MKKILLFTLSFFGLVVISGCSQKEEIKTNTTTTGSDVVTTSNIDTTDNKDNKVFIIDNIAMYNTGELLNLTNEKDFNINEREAFSFIPLDQDTYNRLSGSCFDVRDITQDKKLLYLNINDCGDESIGGFGNVIFNNGKEYMTIYEGQDVISCDTIKAYNIPLSFQGTEGNCPSN